MSSRIMRNVVTADSAVNHVSQSTNNLNRLTETVVGVPGGGMGNCRSNRVPGTDSENPSQILRNRTQNAQLEANALLPPNVVRIPTASCKRKFKPSDRPGAPTGTLISARVVFNRLFQERLGKPQPFDDDYPVYGELANAIKDHIRQFLYQRLELQRGHLKFSAIRSQYFSQLSKLKVKLIETFPVLSAAQNNWVVTELIKEAVQRDKKASAEALKQELARRKSAEQRQNNPNQGAVPNSSGNHEGPRAIESSAHHELPNVDTFDTAAPALASGKGWDGITQHRSQTVSATGDRHNRSDSVLHNVAASRSVARGANRTQDEIEVRGKVHENDANIQNPDSTVLSSSSKRRETYQGSHQSDSGEEEVESSSEIHKSESPKMYSARFLTVKKNIAAGEETLGGNETESSESSVEQPVTKKRREAAKQPRVRFTGRRVHHGDKGNTGDTHTAGAALTKKNKKKGGHEFRKKKDAPIREKTRRSFKKTRSAAKSLKIRSTSLPYDDCDSEV